ncbi:MAG: type II secretion system major pseudopilin GspG [Deltaproteobacteria bacterium]|nr:type II secretion system major pseudopilin GspG [Deltaproteobacteria bacterium]
MTRARKAAHRQSERGMTLIEIMVVLVIIGLVVGVVGVNVFNQMERADKQAACIQIKRFGEAVELYRLAMRQYPGTAEGLNALAQPKGSEKPFMDSVPKDPWDEEYVYIYPGSQNPNGFDLSSKGPDRTAGSADDIGGWMGPNCGLRKE